VTESEPSMSVSDSEPTQNLILSASDQPSSSSHIQILEQPPLNILESEYIEAELLKISEEMQALVQPPLTTLPHIYLFLLLVHFFLFVNDKRGSSRSIYFMSPS